MNETGGTLAGANVTSVIYSILFPVLGLVFLASADTRRFGWMDLLVLSGFLVFGSIIVFYTSAHIREQEETILRLLEKLFGQPTTAKNETP